MKEIKIIKIKDGAIYNHKLLWLNEMLMQHKECYATQKDFPTTHLHYSPTYCSQMLGQGHLAD